MIITAFVKPHARHNLIEWIDEDTVKISVTAVAEKGKANEAVIERLSEELGIAKSRMTIVRGFTTRMKQVEVTISAEELHQHRRKKTADIGKSF